MPPKKRTLFNQTRIDSKRRAARRAREKVEISENRKKANRLRMANARAEENEDAALSRREANRSRMANTGNSIISITDMQEMSILPTQIKLEVEDGVDLNDGADLNVENEEHCYLIPVVDVKKEVEFPPIINNGGPSVVDVKKEVEFPPIINNGGPSLDNAEPYPIAIKTAVAEYTEQQAEPGWIVPDAVSSNECDESVISDGSNSSFTCELCNINYPSLDSLYDHITLTHAASGREPVPGEKSEAVKKEETSSVKTLNTESKCPHCTYINTDALDLQLHIQFVHSQVKQPTSCKLCGKVFSSQRYLAHHEVIHRAKKEFQCQTCGKQFRREGDYKMHLETHTKLPIECKICGKRFILHRNLLQHEVVHREPEKKFECTLCEKRFRRHCDYLAHITAHTRDPFQCNICGRTFPLRRNLLQHGVVHSEERKHECEVCGKKFRRKCDFKIHMQIHSSNAYLCVVCGKSFSLHRSLIQHMSTHNEKPLECDACGKTFKRKSQLYKHLPCSSVTQFGDHQFINSYSSDYKVDFAAKDNIEAFHNGYNGNVSTNNNYFDNVSNMNIEVPFTLPQSTSAITIMATNAVTEPRRDPIVITAARNSSILHDALSVPPSISLIDNSSNTVIENGTGLHQIVSKLLAKQQQISLQAHLKQEPNDT